MDHRGVQRPIAIALWRRDIILEPPRHHWPALVDRAQCRVTRLGIGNDRAKRHDVGQLLEADVALGHFLPDRKNMFFAARNIGFDARAAEQQFQARRNARNLITAAVVQLVKPLADRGIGVRFQLAKRQRLHFVHELIHADPLGKRRINIHCFLGDPPPLGRVADEMQRAHIVQPVGQLDEQHADVVGHRQQELAQIFGRAFILGLRFDFRQLGDAIDEPPDRGAKFRDNLFLRRQRVFDRVMQDRGRNRLIVQVQIGQNPRDFDGMTEIGIARCPQLAPVHLHRKNIGTIEQRLVRVGIIGFDPLNQFILPKHIDMMEVRRRGMQPPNLFICAQSGKTSRHRSAHRWCHRHA